MRYAKYKPTGIAWLPEVPEEWAKVRFWNTVRFKKDRNHVAEPMLSVYLDKGVVYTADTDGKQVHKPPEDLSDYQLVLPGDFVMNNQQCWRGSVGVSCLRGIISPAYFVFELSREYYWPRFADYYLRDRYMVTQYRIASKGVGSIQQILCFPWFKATYSFLPSIEVQKQMASYLDEKCRKVDRLVAAKENEVALLKELKQSMIAEAVTRGVRSKRRLVPSGIPWLPEVPEGWEVKRLKWILEEIKVLSTTGEELPLSLTATDGLIPFSEKANRTMESATYVGAKIVRKGQIVFNRFKARLFAVAPCTGLVSSDYAVYQVRIEVEKKFLLYLFATPTFRQVMNNQASGIGDGFSRLYSSELFKLYVPLPPLVEQREIVAHIEVRAAKIDAAVKGLEREVAALKEYKQRLIADVVTGQRKVA